MGDKPTKKKIIGTILGVLVFGLILDKYIEIEERTYRIVEGTVNNSSVIVETERTELRRALKTKDSIEVYYPYTDMWEDVRIVKVIKNKRTEVIFVGMCSNKYGSEIRKFFKFNTGVLSYVFVRR